jgi:hypothetical protein
MYSSRPLLMDVAVFGTSTSFAESGIAAAKSMIKPRDILFMTLCNNRPCEVRGNLLASS